MKITHIETWPVEMQLAEPYTIAYETVSTAANVFLRMETSSAVIGYGCAAPDLAVTGETVDSVTAVCRDVIAPAFRGSDPLRAAMLMARVRKPLRSHPSAMAMADMASRITVMLSMMGQLLLLLSLPALLASGMRFSLLPLLLLFFAPTVTALLQLALSRTREYQADLDGVRLTGDAAGLASALLKLERHHARLWQRFFLMPWQKTHSSLLLSHPPTEERIRRLQAVAQEDRMVFRPLNYPAM